MKLMHPSLTGTLALAVALGSCGTAPELEYRQISLPDLRDKIAGGWAGQMIGVSYGAPTEFRHRETIIPEDKPVSDYATFVFFKNLESCRFQIAFDQECHTIHATSSGDVFTVVEVPIDGYCFCRSISVRSIGSFATREMSVCRFGRLENPAAQCL